MHNVIIFDCGRVLFSFSDEHLLDVYVGDNPEDRNLIKKAVLDHWGEQDEGKPSEQYYQEAIAMLPDSLHEGARHIIFDWDKEFKPMPHMDEIIHRLKKRGAKIFLLSNMPETFTYHHEALPILNEFDGLVFSFPLKIKKPAPEIYQFLLDQYHLNPKDCLFIDDSQKNLDTATSFGIDTYLFSQERLEDFLWFMKKEEL